MRAWIALLSSLLAACGASSKGGDDGDSDVDADTDTDTDTDTDGLPECPTGEDLILGATCLSQATCNEEHAEDWRCNIAGGVCVEEQWICGDCGYCFYKRLNHLDPPDGWECDAERVRCVPRE